MLQRFLSVLIVCFVMIATPAAYAGIAFTVMNERITLDATEVPLHDDQGTIMVGGWSPLENQSTEEILQNTSSPANYSELKCYVEHIKPASEFEFRIVALGATWLIGGEQYSPYYNCTTERYGVTKITQAWRAQERWLFLNIIAGHRSGDPIAFISEFVVQINKQRLPVEDERALAIEAHEFLMNHEDREILAVAPGIEVFRTSVVESVNERSPDEYVGVVRTTILSSFPAEVGDVLIVAGNEGEGERTAIRSRALYESWQKAAAELVEALRPHAPK